MSFLRDDLRPTGVTASAFVASICIHLLSLAVPLALLQTYDRILPNQAYTTTFVLAVGVTIAILLEALLRYGRSILFANVGAAFDSHMTLGLIDHLMQADGKAVHALGPPALSDALRAVGEVRDFWSGNAAAALHELPFVVIYIGLIAYISPPLSLIPLVLTLVAFLTALFVIRSANRAVIEAHDAEARRRDLAWGIFGCIVEVKAMSAETMLTRRYRDAVAATMDAGVRVEDALTLIRENGALFAQLSTVAVVTAGAFLVISGALTTGGLAACTLLAGRSIGPSMSAFAYFTRLGSRREAEQKLAQVLSLPKAPLWTGGGAETFTGGPIDITGAAIVGGHATVPQGQLVRIDAPDARSATRVLEAITQFDSSPGLTVTYNGKPGSTFDPQDFREKVVIASANTELIRGTLLDNMTLFSPQYNAEAMVLMRDLGLDAFVDGLRQGVMTSLGAAGADVVSPGIAVRVGLIRALVRHPLILCLDEAGGALDLDGVRRLVDILKGLKGQVTVFLVSGNSALAGLADQTIHVGRVDSRERPGMSDVA